jgi:hypothetical protein
LFLPFIARDRPLLDGPVTIREEVMKSVTTSWPRRLLALVMSLVMSVGLLAPAASLAKVHRTLDDGSGLDGRGGEGDPLDSNDHSGGGGGDVIHSDSVGGDDPGGIPLPMFPLSYDGRVIILVPEFRSGTLVFSITLVRVDDSGTKE